MFVALALFASGLGCRGFLLGGALKLFANSWQAKTALLEDLRGEALFFAQQAQKQVLGPDVFMGQALSLFRGVGKNPFALV